MTDLRYHQTVVVIEIQEYLLQDLMRKTGERSCSYRGYRPTRRRRVAVPLRIFQSLDHRSEQSTHTVSPRSKTPPGNQKSRCERQRSKWSQTGRRLERGRYVRWSPPSNQSTSGLFVFPLDIHAIPVITNCDAAQDGRSTCRWILEALYGICSGIPAGGERATASRGICDFW